MRRFTIRRGKRIPAVLAALALICAGVSVVFRLAQVQSASGEIRRLPVYSVETEEKVVALTFDAAWGNSDTDALMEVLGKNEVKATFFVTGDWCDRCGEDVKKLSAAGHAIENHSDAHPHPVQITQKQLIDDTNACTEKIVTLTGVSPKLYRAPYGEYNTSVIEAVEDELGLLAVQWDADSMDWKRIGAEASAQNALSKVQNGSILLFHNDLETTAQAVDTVICRLKASGYRFVLVRDMVYTKDYTIDVAGRQHPKKTVG